MTKSELGSRRQPLAGFPTRGLRVTIHEALDTVMISADQQASGRRSSDPPTLWLSLALGSVLLHLLFFILISVVLTRTAKVELDVEPIAVEFVDPAANPVQARSEASSRAIVARPGQPMPAAPTSRQAPLTTQLPQASVEPRRSLSQPLIPLQPVTRNPIPLRPRQTSPLRTPLPSQTTAATNPTQPQPNPIRDPFLPQPNVPEPTQTQSAPDRSTAQTGLPGSAPNPSGNPEPQPFASQSPVESGQGIAQLPQGRSVVVSVFNAPGQVIFDRQQQSARAKESQKTVLLDYPDTIAQIPGHSIRVQVTLQISDKGQVAAPPSNTSLLSPKGAIIKQADLDYIANQIFRDWEFEPAKNESGLTPPFSNLTIDAQIQFP